MIHLGTNAVWYPPAQHALQHQQPWDKGTEERTKSLNICWWVPAQSHPGVLHPPPPASPTAPGQPLGTIFAAGRQRQDRWWPNRMDAVPKGAASLPGWGETYLVPANGGHETRSLDHSQANLLSVNTRPPYPSTKCCFHHQFLLMSSRVPRLWWLQAQLLPLAHVPHHHYCHRSGAGRRRNHNGSSPSAAHTEGDVRGKPGTHSHPAPLPIRCRWVEGQMQMRGLTWTKREPTLPCSFVSSPSRERTSTHTSRSPAKTC